MTNPDIQTQAQDIGIVPQTPLVIHAQYLKDLSFENPNAPEILKKANKPPEVDINMSVNVIRLEDEKEEYFYEVVLNVNATAMRDGKTMFLAEIKYGATVSIHGLDEKKHHGLLFVEVPKIIFPFVRLILSNATQSGAFIPLQMGMVDFKAMYLKRFGKNPNGNGNANPNAKPEEEAEKEEK